MGMVAEMLYLWHTIPVSVVSQVINGLPDMDVAEC
jgi:hypothetical protein